MLTWNEIRIRVAQFSERWADAVKENAEVQTFWNEFLAVYGVDRRRVAAFERISVGRVVTFLYRALQASSQAFPWQVGRYVPGLSLA